MMNCSYQWCAWCCNLKFPLCCRCCLCRDCCKCPLPMLPCYYPPQPLPPLPSMGPCPPPIRIIREKVLVPVPFPICTKPNPSLPPCWRDPPGVCHAALTTQCHPSFCPPNQCQRDENCCGDSYGESLRSGFSMKGQGYSSRQDSHPCPWPDKNKRIYECDCPIMPGYRGHIPGFRHHSAGRTFGHATRDTCCIMSQWSACCPDLPCRIFEQ